jgi:hypothetical protein
VPAPARVTAAAVAAVAARAVLAARARRRSAFAEATRARSALLLAHRRRRLTAPGLSDPGPVSSPGPTNRQPRNVPSLHHARDEVRVSLAQLGDFLLQGWVHRARWPWTSRTTLLTLNPRHHHTFVLKQRPRCPGSATRFTTRSSAMALRRRPRTAHRHHAHSGRCAVPLDAPRWRTRVRRQRE